MLVYESNLDPKRLPKAEAHVHVHTQVVLPDEMRKVFLENSFCPRSVSAWVGLRSSTVN